MSETLKRRRRWPWVALCAVLLAVSAPIAWHFRPPTATEHRLLGTWHVRSTPQFDPPRESIYHFETRGRCTCRNLHDPAHRVVDGEWSAEQNQFFLRVLLPGSPTGMRLLLWRGWYALQGYQVYPSPQELEFLSENEIRVCHGGIYGSSLWTRITNEPNPPTP